MENKTSKINLKKTSLLFEFHFINWLIFYALTITIRIFVDLNNSG